MVESKETIEIQQREKIAKMPINEFLEHLKTLEDSQMQMELHGKVAELEEGIQALRDGVNVLETECDDAEEKGDEENYAELEAQWECQTDILDQMEQALSTLNTFKQEMEYQKR